MPKNYGKMKVKKKAKDIKKEYKAFSKLRKCLQTKINKKLAKKV